LVADRNGSIEKEKERGCARGRKGEWDGNRDDLPADGQHAAFPSILGPSRENEFQVHVHTSPRIWLKCKGPRRERERPADKCASFETEFRKPPPRVRKRARTKRSHAAGGSRGPVDRVEASEGR